MLKNWLLITSVPFVVGFSATMLGNKNLGQSAVAGSAGVLGVATSMALFRKQRREELDRQLQSIQVAVGTLEQQEKFLNKQLKDHQDNRQTIQYQVEQLEQQLANLHSQLQGQAASAAKFDRELDAKRTNAAELDAAAQAKRADLDAIAADISALQQQQAAAQTSMLNLQDIEAETSIYTATKAQLILEVARLEEYQTEIKIQIADDKEICEKAEEYLMSIDQEVKDKQEDLLELDLNIRTKSTELNNCRTQLSALAQQKIEAEAAITKLAIELQQVGTAVLEQENIQQTAELEAARLSSDIASLKLELLDQHTQMTEPGLQFVEFQPAALLSMTDLEETSPISASYFSDLCEMELSEVGTDNLANAPVEKLNVLSFNDLDLIGMDELDLYDMTMDQSDLDELNLDDMTMNQGDLDELDLDDMTMDQGDMDELDPDDMTIDQDDLVEAYVAEDTAWSASFKGNSHLQILQHIDQHGSIAHFEVAALLNDKKSAKLFGTKVHDYSKLLPFEIEVEPSKTGNKYVKKLGVLAAIS